MSLRDNPFWVLGVDWTTQRAELEREAQKLLGMLELGLAEATFYQTPFGPQQRDKELVRTAIATLRDPVARVTAEYWAKELPMTSSYTAEAQVNPEAEASKPLPAAVSLAQQLGWAPKSQVSK